MANRVPDLANESVFFPFRLFQSLLVTTLRARALSLQAERV